MPVLDEKILREVLEDRAYQQRKEASNPPTKYIILFFLIMFGVACGNLLSNWITAKVAAYEIRKATEQMQAEIKRQDEQRKIENAARAKRDLIIAEEQRRHQEKTKKDRETATYAKQAQIATCKFWIEEYRRTRSEIDKNHRTNACRDAGTTIGN